MLDQTLDQITTAKSGLTGRNGPDADEPIGIDSDSDSDAGGLPVEDSQLSGPGGSLPGEGAAQGWGRRPNSLKAKFYDSNVRQQLGKGAAIPIGEADGPNIKGRVQEQIKAEIESAKHDAADPLTGQRLPRSQREHAKEYFDALREGK